MKQLKRKILIFGLLLGAMSLTACGGGNNNGGGQSGGDASGDASASGKKKGPWTVTFDTNGGAETYDNQIVEHKGYATNPGTPTRVDPVKGTYEFIDWRCEGGAWSFSGSQVTSNITLVANWKDRYAVDIKNADGTAISETTYVNIGTALAKPADPTVPTGKTFYGWMNTKNGGQIWNFDDEKLNLVMDDVELKPLFIDAGQDPQVFEAEECPDFTYDKWGPSGMHGSTWSGAQWGLALIGKDFYDASGKNKYGASGDYTIGASRAAGYVHYMYFNGDTLTWELNSSAAATNVTLFMRISAEYGLRTNPLTDELTSWVDGDTFPVTVNDVKVPYSKITLHNIGAWGDGYEYLPFQDYVLGVNISLEAGPNTIQMKVDNNTKLSDSVGTTAPVVDCIKLCSTSTITWPNANPGNVQ